VFVGDMRAQSIDPRFEAVAAMTMAAGKDLKPIKRIEIQAAPGQTRHWNTYELYYRSGANTNADVNVGQDLYVVIGSKVKGPTDAKIKELAGIGRWDNFFLLTGEL